jgi:hypothetical protein
LQDQKEEKTEDSRFGCLPIFILGRFRSLLTEICLLAFLGCAVISRSSHSSQTSVTQPEPHFDQFEEKESKPRREADCQDGEDMVNGERSFHTQIDTPAASSRSRFPSTVR